MLGASENSGENPPTPNICVMQRVVGRNPSQMAERPTFTMMSSHVPIRTLDSNFGGLEAVWADQSTISKSSDLPQTL